MASTTDAAALPEDLQNKTTIYVNNLDERAKIDLVKDTLRDLFSMYGEVVDIVAKTNLRARGQAFVVFEDHAAAAKALEEVDGFPIFEKPMKCAWARMTSDAIAKRGKTEEEFEVHKRKRQAAKERRQAAEAAAGKKRAAVDGLEQPAAKKMTTVKNAGKAVTAADEYAEPNNTLIVKNIPDDYDHDALKTLFGRFPGFKEVRLVPGRAGLAFVEYADVDGAISAKEKTADMTVGAEAKPLKVTFQP